jgi:hypothetical protein
LQPGIRTADAETQRQFAFGRNPVVWLQVTLEDGLLDLLNDLWL